VAPGHRLSSTTPTNRHRRALRSNSPERTTKEYPSRPEPRNPVPPTKPVTVSVCPCRELLQRAIGWGHFKPSQWGHFCLTFPVVHVVGDACVTLWRGPDYEAPPASSDGASSPFSSDVQERFRILGELMEIAHPHDRPHWYLNVIATVPHRQGHGLGAEALRPVLERCDAEKIPAYLESSNPRNMTLYRRHGFDDVGRPTIDLPDGPSLYPMWREPRA